VRAAKRLKGNEAVRRARVLKFYETAAKKAIAKSLQKAHNESGYEGHSTMFNLITEVPKETVKGTQWYDLDRAYSPKEILLNSWVKKVIPPEVVIAAQQMDNGLKNFCQATSQAKAEAREWGKTDKVINSPSEGKVKVTKVRTTLPPQIYAQTQKVKDKLEAEGYLCEGKPTHNRRLLGSRDDEIVRLYGGIARGLLNYYKCASNLPSIRKIVDYHLRYSCLMTLAGKHKTSLNKTIVKYSKNLEVLIPDTQKNSKGQQRKKYFPTTEEVRAFSRGFSISTDTGPNFWEIVERVYLRASRQADRWECAKEGCTAKDIEMHHVRSLVRKPNARNGSFSVLSTDGKRVSVWKAIQIALNRKQIPLCKKHHAELHAGRLKETDISKQSVLRFLNHPEKERS
jgi:hypothetical protein